MYVSKIETRYYIISFIGILISFIFLLNYLTYMDYLVYINILFLSVLPFIVYIASKDKNIFSPLISFTSVYCIYYVIGSLNITSRGGFIPMENTYYFLIGIISYVIGATITKLYLYSFDKKSNRNGQNYNKSTSYSQNQLKYTGYILYIIGILALLYSLFSTGSIPIFNPELRRETSSYIVVLTHFAWIGLVLLFFNKKRKLDKFNIMLLLLLIALYFLTAFRTPIIIAVLTLVVLRNNLYKKITLKQLAFLLILVLIVGTIIPTIRDNLMYGEDHMRSVYESQGIPSGLFWLAPVYSVLREGPNIFNQILQNLGDNFLNGKAFFSNYLTILPGENYSLRYIVTDIINSPTWVSKTPSIIGALYLDFGLLSIILGMLILGVILQYTYYQMLKSKDLILGLSHSFLIVISLISIHTGGYFEPITVVILFLLFFIRKLTLENNKFKLEKEFSND
ncbi:O-antigen polymerase [Metabacillus niabensis]|uniref:O-antigen polymerase n=1 Tax=Metabacillus niabensis TaxID=324854 RepID=UPI0039A14D96